MFGPLLDHFTKLRELEAAAAEDPGWEADHRHEASAAYLRYDDAWSSLAPLINSGPLPDTWLELDAWCLAHDHLFGDAELPGVHQEECRWARGKRSLRTALAQSVLRRAEERLARPEEAALWDDPRVPGLLRGLAAAAGPAGLVPAALALLGSVAPAVALSPSQAKAYEEHRARLARFAVRDFEVKAVSDLMVMRLGFSETLYRGESVRLSLVERETGEPLGLDVSLRRTEDPQRLAVHKETIPSDIEVGADRVEARAEATGWAHDAATRGAILSVEVRNAGLRCLAGHVPAPAFPEAEITFAPEMYCTACGDTTPVWIERKCPACAVAGLPGWRPLSGDDAAKLEAVRRAWAATACPACKCPRFSRRFHGMFPEDLRCNRCQLGWIVRDGAVAGPDPAARALATLPVPTWWRILGNLLQSNPASRTRAQWVAALCALTDELSHAQPREESIQRLAGLAEALDPGRLDAPLREWLLQVCASLTKYFDSYLVLDSSDGEWKHGVGGVAEAAVARLRSALGVPRP